MEKGRTRGREGLSEERGRGNTPKGEMRERKDGRGRDESSKE